VKALRLFPQGVRELSDTVFAGQHLLIGVFEISALPHPGISCRVESLLVILPDSLKHVREPQVIFVVHFNCYAVITCLFAKSLISGTAVAFRVPCHPYFRAILTEGWVKLLPCYFTDCFGLINPAQQNVRFRLNTVEVMPKACKDIRHRFVDGADVFFAYIEV